MSRWAWIAILAIACGHAPDPVRPPTAVRSDAGVDVDAAPALEDDLPRLATRAVKQYQDLARAVTESDCAAAAVKVNAVADANIDVITANAHVLHAGRDKIKLLRAALAAHKAELNDAAKAIVQSAAMTKCSQDPAF